MADRLTMKDIDKWYRGLNVARTQSGINLASVYKGSYTSKETYQAAIDLLNNISKTRNDNTFLSLADFNKPSKVQLDEKILLNDKSIIEGNIINLLRVCNNIDCKTVCQNTGSNSNGKNTDDTCGNTLNGNGSHQNTSLNNGLNTNGNHQNVLLTNGTALATICSQSSLKNGTNSNGANDNGSNVNVGGNTCSNGINANVKCSQGQCFDKGCLKKSYSNGTNSNGTKTNGQCIHGAGSTYGNGKNTDGTCSNGKLTNGTNNNMTTCAYGKNSNGYNDNSSCQNGNCANGYNSNGDKSNGLCNHGTNTNSSKSNGCVDQIYDPATATYNAKTKYSVEEAKSRLSRKFTCSDEIICEDANILY